MNTNLIFLELSGLSSLTVEQLGPFKFNSLAEATERRMYKGNENFLIYRNTYEIELHCDFNLYNYPFDHQYCKIVVKWNYILTSMPMSLFWWKKLLIHYIFKLIIILNNNLVYLLRLKMFLYYICFSFKYTVVVKLINNYFVSLMSLWFYMSWFIYNLEL